MCADMKQWKWIVCCFLALLLLTGCELELVSPDSLITAPKSDQEKLQQREVISSFLGQGESLIIPEGMKYTDVYQYVDIDCDGTEEMVAFYANKENNFTVGFMILDQKDDEWYLKNKAVAYGTGIHYFKVADLDNDGTEEFLLGVQAGYGSQKELYIYHMDQEKLKDITETERIVYDQITLMDKDNKEHLILTARMDTAVLGGDSEITAFAYEEEKILNVYSSVLHGYCTEMEFGKVHKGTNGVYLAMQNNHFLDILLFRESNDEFAVLLKKSFEYAYMDTGDWNLFRDENDDGILEICSFWMPEGKTADIDYSDCINIWYQWNGAGELRAVDVSLERKNDGYQFNLPVEWVDSIYYKFRTEDNIKWIDFYYENESLHFERVFSIAAIDQLTWDKMQKSSAMTILGNHPSKNKVYVAEILKSQFNNYAISESLLISCLHIEGGDKK